MRVLMATVALALVLSGCGDTGDTGTTPPPTGAPASTAVTQPPITTSSVPPTTAMTTTTTQPPATTTTQPPATTTTQPPTTTTTSRPPTTTTTVPGFDELADGEHLGYLIAVDVAGNPPTLVFDLVQWFTGEEANQAAAEDGEESPVPNDYYIRNVNPRLRILEIYPGATVSSAWWTVDQGGEIGQYPITLEDLSDIVAGAYDGTARENSRHDPWWLTSARGVIVSIDEQYLP